MSFHSLECRTWRSGAGQAIQLHIHRNSSGPLDEVLIGLRRVMLPIVSLAPLRKNLSSPFGWRNVGLR